MGSQLQLELDRRLADGYELVTIREMDARFFALGYSLDRELDCRGTARYLSGPYAGDSYPCITTGVKEADTGLSAFNVKARRDANFQAMQKLRSKVFAVVRGHLFEA